MSEAVNVPRLIVMTSMVSEKSLERDRHTDKHAHRHGLVYVNLSKVLKNTHKNTTYPINLGVS